MSDITDPGWDAAMQKALEDDGEKMFQLTGEDHGPYFFLGEVEIWVPCPACDGAGEWDEGPLPASSGASEPSYRQVMCGHCDGTGKVPSGDVVYQDDRADDFQDDGYLRALDERTRP